MRYRNWLYVPLFIALAVLCWYFKAIISYILVACVISLIGEPIIRILLNLRIKGWKLPPSLAALLTLGGLFAFFGGIISMFIPLVAAQARKLSELSIEDVMLNIRQPVESLQYYINQFKLSDQPIVFEHEIRDLLANLFDLSSVGSSLQYAVGLAGDVFIAVFAILFISFFFMKDQGLLKKMIMTLVPSGHEKRFGSVLSKSKKLLTRYFIGVIIEVTIVTAIVSSGLSLIGIENALLIGFIAGIFNIIPYVGPMIGAAIGIIIGLSTNSDGLMIGSALALIGKMAIVYGAAQLLDNMVLQPYIYSQSVKAHPLEIFIVILMAGNVAGMAGMIFAVPTYSIIRVFVGEFFNQFKLVKALTSEMED